MTIDRRAFVAGLAAAAAPSLAYAQGARATAPVSAFGIDAATLGVRAGSPEDQTPVLQRAIEQAAAARARPHPSARGPERRGAARPRAPGACPRNLPRERPCAAGRCANHRYSRRDPA